MHIAFRMNHDYVAYLGHHIVQLTIREWITIFKVLAGAAEPRRPPAADGRPFGGQRRLSGGPHAAWAAAAGSLLATVQPCIGECDKFLTAVELKTKLVSLR